MTVLNYKGYQGSVSFESGKLLIQILHIDDFITTECETASNVAPSFRGLVDDYVETCQAMGKEPCKPFKGSLNIRISPRVHRGAAMAAAEESISLNALIGKAIEDYISKNNERHRHFAEALLIKISSLPDANSSNSYKKAEVSAFGVVHARDDAFGLGKNQPDVKAILVRRPIEFGAF